MKKRQIKKQQKMRNKRLIKQYPFLLPRNVYSDKVPSNYDYEYTEYDALLKGWKIGFGQFLLEDLREACLKTGYLDQMRIEQLKEKYIVTNDNIYKVVEKNNKTDEYDIFNATQNLDGTIDYEVMYYNGGCSFNEAIEYALEAMK